MTWRTFLGIDPSPDGGCSLPVTEAVTGGVGQLFGGVGVGVAVALVEEQLGRPAAWATAQFVSNAFPPESVGFTVEVPALGRNFSQARVVGRVGDREVLTVAVAVGSKPFPVARSWRSMPAVEPPERCEPLPPLQTEGAGLHTRIEQRLHLGGGSPDGERGDVGGDGTTSVWMRLPERLAGTTLGLAIVGDFLPLGFRAAIGGSLFGVSLDNTLRFVRRAETDWVLAHIVVDEVAGGVGHGMVQLWSQDGALLAIASQTCTMRMLDGP